MSQAVVNAMGMVRAKKNPIEKHLFLAALQQTNMDLFYALMLAFTDELLPIVYTPHVGAVCETFSALFPRAKTDGRGLFISIHDKGNVTAILRSLKREVGAIVVTDGQRILGLGDLGVNGMGIPIGKLALYTALAGVPPHRCLPVTLDVGTDTKSILADPTYIGNRHVRVTGDEYYAFLDEFVTAADQVFDTPLIQFEDFGNANAFELIERYKDKVCCFNDDIQGTASVVLAGLIAAARVTGKPLKEGTYLLFGAGEASIGIADLLVAELVSHGVDKKLARSRIFMIDSKGLVVTSRKGLTKHKLHYAQEHAPLTDLLEIVNSVKPTALIGVGAVPKVFTPQVLQRMATLNARPIIFALSNPTVKSECTAEEAYLHTKGTALFASGSPFDPVTQGGKTLVPGQCNNSYIFPGVGLAVTYTRATRVVEDHFLLAAHVLAEATSAEQLASSCLFPPLSLIRDVSLSIALKVTQHIVAHKLHRVTMPSSASELAAAVSRFRYQPSKASL